MSKLTDKLELELSCDIIELGLELEYIELVKEGTESILRIVVDKPNNNICVDDCEALSRKIEDKVEGMIKIEGGYILEVSSAGLERQIKNNRLFEKYKGNKIRVKLYSKINDKKEYEGILNSVNDSEIEINVDEKIIKIEMKNIASANTVYDF